MRRWFHSLGWVTGLFVLASGGCVSDFDRGALDGRPCPCLPGWVCIANPGAGGICRREGSELADNLRDTSANLPDAGSGGAIGVAGAGSMDAAISEAGAATPGAIVPTGCASLAEPSGAACPALCDECVDGTCFIHCNGTRQCGGTSNNPATLACPAGFHCTVSCESDSNCSHLRVECPGELACTTECTGKKSCNTLLLACATGPCSLVCGSATQACRSSELYCGAGACQASCAGSEAPTVTGCATSCSAQCGC